MKTLVNEILDILESGNKKVHYYAPDKNPRFFFTMKEIKKEEIEKYSVHEIVGITKIPEKHLVVIFGSYLESLKRFLEDTKEISIFFCVNMINTDFLFIPIEFYEKREKNIKQEIYWSIE